MEEPLEVGDLIADFNNGKLPEVVNLTCNKGKGNANKVIEIANQLRILYSELIIVNVEHIAKLPDYVHQELFKRKRKENEEN